MTKRFWLLMIVLICLSKGKAQQNYYDTDFTLSHQSFVFTIPIEVIVENKGRAMVGMVLNNSRAWADGFRYGQVIEQINGESISFEQFLRFNWVKDAKYKFTISLPQGTRETIQALWPFQYN